MDVSMSSSIGTLGGSLSEQSWPTVWLAPDEMEAAPNEDWAEKIEAGPAWPRGAGIGEPPKPAAKPSIEAKEATDKEAAARSAGLVPQGMSLPGGEPGPTGIPTQEEAQHASGAEREAARPPSLPAAMRRSHSDGASQARSLPASPQVTGMLAPPEKKKEVPTPGAINLGGTWPGAATPEPSGKDLGRPPISPSPASVSKSPVPFKSPSFPLSPTVSDQGPPKQMTPEQKRKAKHRRSRSESMGAPGSAGAFGGIGIRPPQQQPKDGKESAKVPLSIPEMGQLGTVVPPKANISPRLDPPNWGLFKS